MPESVSRRMKRLEQRVERIAPGKRDLFYMRVPRDRYEEAKGILSDLPMVASDSTDPPEAVEVQLEPERVTAPSRKAQTEEPDEFSDRARLKHLRDLSNAASARDWHGGQW